MEACPSNVFVASTKIKDGSLSAVVSVDGGPRFVVEGDGTSRGGILKVAKNIRLYVIKYTT